MPATRRSMAPDASPLKVITNKPAAPPQLTPGKKVVALTAALEEKDVQNRTLQSTVDELAGALAGLTVAKDKLDADEADDAAAAGGKKGKAAPRPAKTAYKFFCDARPKVEGGAGALRPLWKEASPEVRQSYEAMARADKARHAREAEEQAALRMYYDQKKQARAMEFYEAHLAAEAAKEKAEAEARKGKKKAKAKKDPEAPKRPLSSYMYFAQDKREAVAKKHPDAAPKEVVKMLGEMWQQLDKGQAGRKGTKKYDDLAAEDKARYDGEKRVYDAMIAERQQKAAQELTERRNKDKEEALELLKSRQAAAALAGPAMTIHVPAADVAPVPSVALDHMSVASALSTAAPTKAAKKKKDPNAPKRALTAYNFFTKEQQSEIRAQMQEGASGTEVLVEVGRRWKALTPAGKEKYAQMAREDKERHARDVEKYHAGKQ